jgi:hypothetical protein
MAARNIDNAAPFGSPFTLGALNAEAIFEITGARNVNVQLTGTFVGTVSYAQSNDQTNWSAVTGVKSDTTGIAGDYASSDTAPIMRKFPANGRFMRVRMTAYTSGSAKVDAVLKGD